MLSSAGHRRAETTPAVPICTHRADSNDALPPRRRLTPRAPTTSSNNQSPSPRALRKRFPFLRRFVNSGRMRLQSAASHLRHSAAAHIEHRVPDASRHRSRNRPSDESARILSAVNLSPHAPPAARARHHRSRNVKQSVRFRDHSINAPRDVLCQRRPSTSGRPSPNQGGGRFVFSSKHRAVHCPFIRALDFSTLTPFVLAHDCTATPLRATIARVLLAHPFCGDAKVDVINRDATTVHLHHPHGRLPRFRPYA